MKLKIQSLGNGTGRPVNPTRKLEINAHSVFPVEAIIQNNEIADKFEKDNPALPLYLNAEPYMGSDVVEGERVWQAFRCKVGGSGPFWLDEDSDTYGLYKSYEDFKRFYSNPPRGWGGSIETRQIYRITPSAPDNDKKVAEVREGMQTDHRFEIENSGRRLLKFVTEAHIKDALFPDATIIVQSGFTTLKETDEYAELICKILNEATRK